MIAIISPGHIKGEIKVPASKSMMQRVCAAALLHKGKTIVHNAGVSEDDKAAVDIISRLGATVNHINEGAIEIRSNGLQPKYDSIYCGESGLAARLFIPIAALHHNKLTIEGKGSLLQRPMSVHKDVLAALGVAIEDSNGRLPFILQGPLHPKNIEIDGSESSQFLSGLLFAYAFAATEKVVIAVNDLKSKPYVDMTIAVLELFGRKIQHLDYKEFIIDPSLFDIKEEIEITIEGDWSAAVNWLVAGAIKGDLKLKGLNAASKQADIAILDVLQMTNTEVRVDKDSIAVNNSNRIEPFDFDATDCPDMFPALAVLAACSKGESHITGVHRLLNKESNRIVSMGDMLNEFGIFFSIEDDTIVIEGQGSVEHATIDSYNDHRIVMAAAVAALKAWKPVVITDAEAVNKSYPRFFDDFTTLGADCILKEE